jgi:hypothetical protein
LGPLTATCCPAAAALPPCCPAALLPCCLAALRCRPAAPTHLPTRCRHQEIELLDTDGDGTLDRAELMGALSSVCGFATHAHEGTMVEFLLQVRGVESVGSVGPRTRAPWSSSCLNPKP